MFESITQLRTAPTQRRLELSDGRFIGVRDWPGDGPPLVLLHGLLDSGEGWDWLALHTPQRCIAIDLPGFGASDLPQRPRLDSYAADVIAALDLLDVRRCLLAGHSLGGAVAAAVADREPQRVSALALLAPAGFGRIRLAEAVSLPGVRNLALRALPLALANPAILTAAYMTFVTNGELPTADVLQRVMRKAFNGAAPGAREATRAIVAAGLSAHGLHRRRLRYCGPVRVLWGECDRVVPPEHIEGVLQGLPHAEVEVWPEMGHHPIRERASELLGFMGALAHAAEVAPALDLPRAA